MPLLSTPVASGRPGGVGPKKEDGVLTIISVDDEVEWMKERHKKVDGKLRGLGRT